VLALVTLQHADGSWDLTSELAAILGRTLEELDSALGANSTRAEERRAWATALALAWLAEHGGAMRDQWRLLANKARTWLNFVAPKPEGGRTWVGEAEMFMLPKA